MPVSVDQLFKELNLTYSQSHKWKQKLNANFNGVYILSTSKDPKSMVGTPWDFNICSSTFNAWLLEAPELQIEGKKVENIGQVENYLRQFWKKDENILYIGESTSPTNPIQKRVDQYYQHKVGQKGPHSGGYWLKLLSCLKDLNVYFAQCSNPRETEFKLIMKFVELSSGQSFYSLKDFSNYFPFANLKVDVLKTNLITNPVNKNKKKSKKS